jgi:hypothetical protein
MSNALIPKHTVKHKWMWVDDPLFDGIKVLFFRLTYNNKEELIKKKLVFLMKQKV